MTSKHEKWLKIHTEFPYIQFRKPYCEACGVGNDKSEERDEDGFLIRRKKNHRLTIHHKDKDHTNNEPENLMTLCEFHHNYLHNYLNI